MTCSGLPTDCVHSKPDSDMCASRLSLQQSYVDSTVNLKYPNLIIFSVISNHSVRVIVGSSQNIFRGIQGKTFLGYFRILYLGTRLNSLFFVDIHYNYTLYTNGHNQTHNPVATCADIHRVTMHTYTVHRAQS